MILGFCYNNLTLEIGGFELASTFTLVLQVNRLTKCASHPKSKIFSTKNLNKIPTAEPTPEPVPEATISDTPKLTKE